MVAPTVGYCRVRGGIGSTPPALRAYRVLNAKDEYGPKDGFKPDSGNILNNQNKSYGDDIDNIFPYSFGDWDNFDFNIALNYCFCDILGMDRPDLAMTRSGKTSPMTDQAMIIQRNAVKVDVSVMEQELGRFGNVIYR